jgi:hypothetical protein
VLSEIEVQHHHARHDQADPEPGRPVEPLAEDRPADHGDRRHAEARPDRVGHAQRQHQQHPRQKVEGDAVGDTTTATAPGRVKPTEALSAVVPITSAMTARKS